MVKAIRTTTVEVKTEGMPGDLKYLTLGDLEEFVTSAFANGFTREMIPLIYDNDDSEFIKTSHVKISRPHLS